jgi:hypothetical protein
MMTHSYRGIVQGGQIVLEQDVELSDGTQVVVTPVHAARGSSAALIAAMEAAPHVPSEWVDELEQLIREGRRPPSAPIEFADDEKSQEVP